MGALGERIVANVKRLSEPQDRLRREALTPSALQVGLYEPTKYYDLLTSLMDNLTSPEQVETVRKRRQALVDGNFFYSGYCRPPWQYIQKPVPLGPNPPPQGPIKKLQRAYLVKATSRYDAIMNIERNCMFVDSEMILSIAIFLALAQMSNKSFFDSLFPQIILQNTEQRPNVSTMSTYFGKDTIDAFRGDDARAGQFKQGSYYSVSNVETYTTKHPYGCDKQWVILCIDETAGDERFVVPGYGLRGQDGREGLTFPEIEVGLMEAYNTPFDPLDIYNDELQEFLTSNGQPVLMGMPTDVQHVAVNTLDDFHRHRGGIVTPYSYNDTADNIIVRLSTLRS